MGVPPAAAAASAGRMAFSPMALQPGVPMGYGGAPLGGAPPMYVPAGRAPHPYAAPFPSAPYTSMYSMSPQAYYSFLNTGMRVSAYAKKRKMMLEEAQKVAARHL